jgi:putative spermidine/putrescine transport system ATP-binding protein
MNTGRMEQIDTSSAVYDRPETLFVAGFIGVMNVLPVHLSGGALHAGPFRLSLSEEQQRALADPQAIDLAARPEDVELLPRDDAEAGGKVEQVVDLGPVRHAIVACDGGTRIKVQAPRQMPVSVGDEVGIKLHRALVYRDGAQPLEIARRDPTVLPFRRVASPQ